MAKNEQVVIGRLEPIQTRCEVIDTKTVKAYAQAMQDGADFPPVKVFKQGRSMWLADGNHRVAAAREIGLDTILAEVCEGTHADALRCALSCNVRNGLRVTNDDKQHALRLAWDNRRELWPQVEGAEPSAGVLAEVCGVHENTARKFLAELQPTQNVEVGQPPKMPVRKVFGVDGKTRTMPVRPVRAPLPTAQQPTASVPAAADADGDQPAATKKAPQRPVYRDKNGGEHCVPLDRFDREIPKEVGDALENQELIDGLLSSLSKIRSTLRNELENKNIKLAAVRQEALFDLDNAYNFIKAAKPYCVCPVCDGFGHGCKACHGRGWQTEDEYERNPKEFKTTAWYSTAEAAAGADSDDDESEVQA